MGEWADRLFEWLLGIPEPALYIVLGLASALENVVPPIPADVVVLLGGVLAGLGGAKVALVFLVVWAANVGGALAVYLVGRRYGTGFFGGPVGQLILRPPQLATLASFYQKYGLAVIFFSRFLPMFRAVVPVFAGVAGVSLPRTALPLALASAIWYGLIVYAGSVAGRNWHLVLDMLDSIGIGLAAVAALVALVIFLWWRRSRHGRQGTGPGSPPR